MTALLRELPTPTREVPAGGRCALERRGSARSPNEAPELRTVREGLVLHLPELRVRARYLCRQPDLAEELVQDTAVRALFFAHTFQVGSQLRAWLMRILKNVFISKMRRRSIEQRVLEGARVDPNGWASRTTVQDHHEMPSRVGRALSALPPQLRETVVLVDLEELSYREAAERQQVPVGTIMSRLHRGRARLRLPLAEAAPSCAAAASRLH